MFIGHFGAGLAGKKAAPGPSLGTMFLAAQLLDLVWPILILTGIEKVKIVPGISAANPLEFTFYPYTHSLLMVLVWSLVFGLIYYLIKKNFNGAIVLGLLVLSHWVLDLLVHIPDLPLYPGSSIKAGLGLWNYPIWALVVEILIFTGGIYLYLSCTRTKNKTGTITFWALIAFLSISYLMSVFGPPPPSVEAIGYAGLLQWLFIPWAYWIDKNRISVTNKSGQIRQPA
jgi:hypothetical protein